MTQRFLQCHSVGLSKVSVLTFALMTMAAHGPVGAAGRTYSTNADFALGLLENLNFSVSNQLQVNLIGVGSRFIFVANHNEDSVSKFDTTDVRNPVTNVVIAPGKEVARYKTFASNIGASAGGHPSRIAIDVDGNAYVLNRMDGLNSPPVMTKILVDTAIDHNGNGAIDTSEESNGTAGIQAAEIKPLSANTNAALQDDRVAWIRSIGTGTSFGRSACIAPDGKLWVGIWNQARYYRIDPTTGDTLPIPGTNAAFVQLSGWNPYGCTVDRNGILWSATLQGHLGRVDTNAGTFSRINNPYSSNNYGIAQGNGKIYQAPFSGGYGWAAFDPTAGTWARSPQSFSGAGIAVDGEGNILSTDYSGIRKYKPDGTLLWSKSEGGTTYGVMIDGNNDVWVMNVGTNRTTKYRGADGSLVGFLPTGANPYVYTDGSGLTTKNTTVNKLGTWTVVYDSGSNGTPWGKISWTDSVPIGAIVDVQLRASDNPAALDLQAYSPVAKNANFPGSGRYLQVRARLQMNAINESPTLFDLTVASQTAATCDIDSNGKIDNNDLGAVRSAIGQAVASGDARDANGDGRITINDVRACVLRCTSANCAVN